MANLNASGASLFAVFPLYSSLITKSTIPQSLTVRIVLLSLCDWFIHPHAVVASFFSERIEKVTAEGGSTVFIQRPRARVEGFVASADDMPDNFDVNNVTVSNAQVYRISVGHIGVSSLS